MECHQSAEAVVPTAVTRPLVVPSRVHEVDVAARREGDRREGTRGVVAVHALDDETRGLERNRLAPPRVPQRHELTLVLPDGAISTISAIAAVGDLAVRLADRAARGVVDGARWLARPPIEPPIEGALVARIEDHPHAPVGVGGRLQLAAVPIDLRRLQPPARKLLVDVVVRHVHRRDTELTIALKALLHQPAVRERLRAVVVRHPLRHVVPRVARVVVGRWIVEHLRWDIVPREL